MPNISTQLRGIADGLASQLGSWTELPKIDVPFTTITKRAQMTDLSKDLLPRMGLERIMVQGIQEVPGETGPSSERVFKAINDIHDQIRFVGNASASFVSTNGQGVDPGDSTGFIEVSFYGTGLNLIGYYDTNARTIGVSIDGGSVTNVLNTGQSVLIDRGYAMNASLALVSGLTLGHHTAKLTFPATRPLIFGFEIVCASGTSPFLLQVPTGSSYAGGKKLRKANATAESYNTVFEGTGILGSRGGHVVVYQKADGSIGKAVQPAGTTQLNMASANHADEELTRTHYWREFGASSTARTDDFSFYSSTSITNLAYTLDDNTTSLTAFQCRMISNGADPSINIASNPSHLLLTFVGTGLDITMRTDGSTTTCLVDGTLIGTFSVTAALTKTKIVSGLPYGTHTVRFANIGANFHLGHVFVYGPKKPAIPAGAVELASYCVMANFDYTGVSGTTTADNLKMPVGILAKSPTREVLYGGTGWTIDQASSGTFAPHGNQALTSTASDSALLTFFGTGVEVHLGASGVSFYAVTIQIDGVANATGAVSGGIVHSGSGVYDTVVSGSNQPARVAFTGLTLGVHTVKVTRNSGTGATRLNGFNVITPIHAPKGNLPGSMKSSSMVGSCSVADGRQFGINSIKELSNWAQATNITTEPTTTVSSFSPIPDMHVLINTTGNPVQISYMLGIRNGNVSSSRTAVFIDGIQWLGPYAHTYSAVAGANTLHANTFIAPLSAGVHIIQVMFMSPGGGTVTAEQRSLTVREL